MNFLSYLFILRHESMYPIDYDTLQRSIIKIYEFIRLDNPDHLYPYQEFIRRFMAWHTPYVKIILFWPVGSGKSFAMIAPAIDNYLSHKIKSVVVTKGDSGTISFKKQVLEYKKYFHQNFNENEIFEYIHYMSLTNRLKNFLKQDLVKYMYRRFYIFDEIHHIQEGVNLETIKKIVKESTQCKFVFATATPMINSSDQLKSLEQMLGSLKGILSYNSLIKNKPRVIYEGNNNEITNFPIYVSEMIAHQRTFYLEKLLDDSLKDIYLSQTHLSLFVTPDKKYGSTILGIREKDTGYFLPLPESEQHYIPFIETKKSKTVYMQSTKNLTEILYKEYKIDSKYRKYLKGRLLRECSAKYYTLMNIIEEKNLSSPILIFLPQVHGSGLYLLCNILEEHGYSLYHGEQISRIRKQKRYTFCTGDQSHSHNFDKIDGFNCEENKYGEYVRIIIGSNVIAESITLFNVRQFHALTPHWNESSIDQAIGRVVRNNSHSQLSIEEREVKIYLHACTINGEFFETCIDIKKILICNKKQTDISKMENWMKEIAVDRYINYPIKNIENFNYDSFIIYQIDKYFDKYFENIKKIHFPCNLQKIVNILNIHESIVLELLTRIITKNIEIKPNRYLREDLNHTFFITSIIELPFIITNSKIQSSFKEISNKKETNIKFKHFPVFTNDIDFFHYIQTIDFNEKVLYLESLIKENKYNLYRYFDPLFYTEDIDNGSIYHVMNYCLKDSSYTASSPIPKMKDLGLMMRVLHPISWDHEDIKIPFDFNSLNIEKHEFLLCVQSQNNKYDYYIYNVEKEENIISNERQKIKLYHSKEEYGPFFLIYFLFDFFNIFKGSLSEIKFFFKKLKKFKNLEWKNIEDSIKEQEIVVCMTKKFESINLQIHKYPFFLIFSCNDNEFRIKIRNEELNSSDKRREFRGRTLKSMKKLNLNILYQKICVTENVAFMTLVKIKDIIDQIQRTIIRKNKILIY